MADEQTTATPEKPAFTLVEQMAQDSAEGKEVDVTQLLPQAEAETDVAESEETEEVSTEDAPDDNEKVRALKRQLKRKSAQVKDSEAKSQAITERLARLEGAQDERNRQGKEADDPNAQYTDEQLADFEIMQIDALTTAKAAGDDAAAKKALSQMAAIRAEQTKRQQRQMQEGVTKQATVSKSEQEAKTVYDDAIKAYPDLANKDSEIVKEVLALAKQFPNAVELWGNGAEGTLLAYALLRKPELLAQKTRKQLINDLQSVSESALPKGSAGGTPVKSTASQQILKKAETDPQGFLQDIDDLTAGKKSWQEFGIGTGGGK